MDICIGIALTSLVLVRLPEPVTLAWRHSVEQVQIEEDYRLEGNALRLAEVRTQGPAAGIDPPLDARFQDGWWRYRPTLGLLPSILLRNFTQSGGYRVCAGGRCVLLTDFTGGRDELLFLAPCMSATARTKKTSARHAALEQLAG